MTNLSINQKLNNKYLALIFIMLKPESTIEDEEYVKDFITKYNQLINCNDYLIDDAKIVFKQMSNVLYRASQIDNKTNNAKQILNEYKSHLEAGTNNDYIASFNYNGSSMGKDTSLVRTSSNHPSIISEDYKMSGGFLSFIGLLYIAFNLLITLVILAIKK